MKNEKKLSVMNLALKDISDYYKSAKDSEIIEQMNDPVTHQRVESYIPAAHYLNNSETTRLNRALGLNIINRFKK